MLIRQKILLNLIDQAGGKLTRLHLVKMSFMLAKTSKSKKLDSFYKFLPYRFGPFSFALYHELDKLSANGYLFSEKNRDFCLNKDIAIPKVDKDILWDIKLLVRKYKDYSTEKLINIIYSENPWYTVNSFQKNLRKMDIPTAAPGIYLAGYEGLQIDEFLDLILRSGIKQIVDIRSNPIARRYGFHKSTLAGLCKKVGLKYQHIPELGISSVLRSDAKTKDDYLNLFSLYTNKIIPSQEESIKHIIDLITSLPSVLVCMEEEPNMCHRYYLAQHLSKIINLPISDLRREQCQKNSRLHESSLLL